MIEKMNEKMPKAPEVTPVAKVPVAKSIPRKMPVTPVKEKKQGGGNTFIAVIISLVITMLLMVAGLYLGQKYMIEPSNNEMKEQYSVLETKVSDLSGNLDNEKNSIQELLISIDELKMEIEDLKKVDDSVFYEGNLEINSYMEEEFTALENWQSYENEDLGIEFQYPIDWEIIEGENNNIFVQMTGSTELFNNWDAPDPEENVFAENPYESNIEISLIVENDKDNFAALISNEYFTVNNFLVDGQKAYGWQQPAHMAFGSYQILIENDEEKLKYKFDILRNKYLQKDKTELDILKTLKFTK